MEVELTDDMISQLCMYMRTIDLFNKHPEILDPAPDIKEKVEIIKEKVDQIFSLLTEEQCNEVLEIHRIQLQEIAEMEDEELLEDDTP